MLIFHPQPNEKTVRDNDFLSPLSHPLESVLETRTAFRRAKGRLEGEREQEARRGSECVEHEWNGMEHIVRVEHSVWVQRSADKIGGTSRPESFYCVH